MAKHSAKHNQDGSRVARGEVTDRPMLGQWELVRRKENSAPLALGVLHRGARARDIIALIETPTERSGNDGTDDHRDGA